MTGYKIESYNFDYETNAYDKEYYENELDYIDLRRFNYEFTKVLDDDKQTCREQVLVFLGEQELCFYDLVGWRNMLFDQFKHMYGILQGYERSGWRFIVPHDQSFEKFHDDFGPILYFIARLFAVAIRQEWDEADMQNQLKLGQEPIQLKTIRMLYNAMYCCNPDPELEDRYDCKDFRWFFEKFLTQAKAVRELNRHKGFHIFNVDLEDDLATKRAYLGEQYCLHLYYLLRTYQSFVIHPEKPVA